MTARRRRRVIRLGRIYFSDENPLAEDGYSFFDGAKRARRINRGAIWGFHGGSEDDKL